MFRYATFILCVFTLVPTTARSICEAHIAELVELTERAAAGFLSESPHTPSEFFLQFVAQGPSVSDGEKQAVAKIVGNDALKTELNELAEASSTEEERIREALTNKYELRSQELADLESAIKTIRLYTQLESDLVDLLVLHPDLRTSARSKYAQKYDLQVEDIKALELYMGAIYFGEARLVSTTPKSVLDKLRALHRVYRYSHSRSAFKKRYLYYHFNSTKLSIPEMAKQLSLSEAQVYSELTQFGVAVKKQFSRPLSKERWKPLVAFLTITGKGDLIPELSAESTLELAKRLVQEGISVKTTADFLGVGRQALDFILHHEHEKNRGVRWDRTVPGKEMTEEAYLRQQYEAEVTAQAIADALNSAFGTAPSHENYRTAASVTAKLRVLFPQPPRISQLPKEVRDPLLTDKFLKKGGKIQKENALDFISRHYFQQDAWLADTIGVPLSTLQSFLRKHNVPTEGRRLRARSQSNEAKVEEILEGHEAHRKEHLEQNLESFMNLESGPLLVLKDLPGFPTKTRESFQPLFKHLPQETRTALTARIESHISNKTAGHTALSKNAKGRLSPSRQIQDVFYWISEAHNEWVRANPSRGKEVNLENLSTEAGAREALFILTQRISLKEPKSTESFMDLETGGILAFKGLPGFSRYTKKFFPPLFKHLPQETRTALTARIESHISSKAAGHTALSKSATVRLSPSQQIQDVFYWISEAHNEWVRANPSRGKEINLENLSTEAGAREALFILTQRISLKDPKSTESFMDLETGGIIAFRGLPDFSSDTKKSFRPFFQHLPQETRTALMARIESHISSKTAGATALSKSAEGRLSPSQQIQDVFYWIAEAHNEWVRANPSRGKEINLENLSTEAGAREALFILTQRISLKDPKSTESFMDLETGGILAFKGLRGFSRETKKSFPPLFKHLPEQTRTALVARIESHIASKTAGATALSKNATGRRGPSEQIQDAFYWIVEAHNDWVSQDASRSNSHIDVSTMNTKQGAESIIEKLKRASEN